MTTQTQILTPQQLEAWKRDGFLAVRGLFSPAEVAAMREHFMAIQNSALNPDSPLREFYKPLSMEEAGGDILKHYPRVMHPHRFDETAMNTMLDERYEAVLTQLFGEEPLAAQSMLYFKPPGARGQALHQDNFYLNVRPGTCMAAWLSLDDADAENGGMFLVPGSHEGGVLCPHMADMEKSFTTEEVSIPAGLQAVQVPLKAGDVLFFNGSVIHGSTPNSSKERFRRAFICHYVGDSMTSMAGGYYPLRRFDGSLIERESAPGALNTCGAEDWAAYKKQREAWMEDHSLAGGAGLH